MRIGSHDPGQALRKFLDFCDIGSTHPVLHGAPDRRPDFEQFDERVRTRKGPPQICFELRLEAVTNIDAALGYYDHLAEPGIRRL